VNIVTLGEADITHLQIGFKGTMNGLFLKKSSREDTSRAEVF
jgi:hypothetical protein